ncbi:hypothetical protein ARMGADRAFT_1082655 [Armillaria gallica]|uniref:Uncharacterized protein n=1 Tax=Armillaria gallica TaxID=47427 RepID=A0A2H3D534_ARMGA|nr:hypothetical protein ARMGADRAFT_1082655 [Armillaria gallica]
MTQATIRHSPIFGEDEGPCVCDYLTINVHVIHLGLVQLLSINYMEKLGDSSTVDALDGNLKDFKPPEHEASYGCCQDETPGRRESHRETQLCILLYVEGVSYTREEDQWEFAALYKKRGQRDEILHITSSVLVLVLTFTIS